MVESEGHVEQFGAELEREGTVGPADDSSVRLLHLRAARQGEGVWSRFWLKHDPEKRGETHHLSELVFGPPPPDDVLVRDHPLLDFLTRSSTFSSSLIVSSRVLEIFLLGVPFLLIKRFRPDLEKVGHPRVPDLATGGDGDVGEGQFGRDELLLFHLDAVVVHHVARDLFLVVFERAAPCAFFSGEAVVFFFGLLSRFNCSCCRKPVRAKV